VDIAVDSDLGLVHLSVTDTGPGIPEADWSRVFDRFYRRDDSGQQGSGLGLAIVKNVVDRHGGNVRLGRGPGDKGLAVTMEFPGS
jgi:signal transduction histidine kinase